MSNTSTLLEKLEPFGCPLIKQITLNEPVFLRVHSDVLSLQMFLLTIKLKENVFLFQRGIQIAQRKMLEKESDTGVLIDLISQDITG